MKPSGFLIVAITLILIAFAWNAGHQTSDAEKYYRGVYETCLQSLVKNGQYTRFDQRVCETFEQNARQARWYEKEMARP